jgi:asparaginyl-tRNA synthetase
MDLAEEMIKYVFSCVLDDCGDEMEFFDSFIDRGIVERLRAIIGSSFERITYTEAIDMLISSGHVFEYAVRWGIDLQTEHEKYLTEVIYKKPVFVVDYPKEIKAFYMKLNKDGKTVAAMDLLVPGVGEMIGGSQREDDYDVLLSRMKESGLKEEDYWWYLDLRKYGTNRHAGFGLGFERAIMYLTGMTNIRDVISFPRTPNNAEF